MWSSRLRSSCSKLTSHCKQWIDRSTMTSSVTPVLRLDPCNRQSLRAFSLGGWTAARDKTDKSTQTSPRILITGSFITILIAGSFIKIIHSNSKTRDYFKNVGGVLFNIWGANFKFKRNIRCKLLPYFVLAFTGFTNIFHEEWYHVFATVSIFMSTVLIGCNHMISDCISLLSLLNIQW